MKEKVNNDFLNKWVTTYRVPVQGRPLGRVQCVFVTEETSNRIRGTESGEKSGHHVQFNKNEIVRIINQNEVEDIRNKQWKVCRKYDSKKERLDVKFRVKLKNTTLKKCKREEDEKS